jgi:hypothetical protein
VNHNRNGKFCNSKMAGSVVRVLAVALVALAISGIASAQNDWASTLQFEGGIGVTPVTGVAANGTVNLNVVRGVPPAGPWRIAALEASVRPDGHIKVVGRGLLLAAGNGIGTNGNQSVHATLFCGPAASATAHDSTLAGVALAADGDFRINDFLTPAPPVPCTTPVLLIRNVGGLWFAAGIPDQEK